MPRVSPDMPCLCCQHLLGSSIEIVVGSLMGWCCAVCIHTSSDNGDLEVLLGGHGGGCIAMEIPIRMVSRDWSRLWCGLLLV